MCNVPVHDVDTWWWDHVNRSMECWIIVFDVPTSYYWLCFIFECAKRTIFKMNSFYIPLHLVTWLWWFVQSTMSPRVTGQLTSVGAKMSCEWMEVKWIPTRIEDSPWAVLWIHVHALECWCGRHFGVLRFRLQTEQLFKQFVMWKIDKISQK